MKQKPEARKLSSEHQTSSTTKRQQPTTQQNLITATHNPVVEEGLAAEKKIGGGIKIEDLLEEQLRREMFLESGKKFRYIDDWDSVMHSVYEIPLEYGGYTKRVPELRILKEMVDMLTSGGFEEVKRSESRRKQMREFTRTMSMYYNLIFGMKDHKVGYGALIYFPELNQKQPERSKGIVLIAKCVVKEGEAKFTYEKARFDDFLIEVKPYIELLGDLYRAHKPT